MARQPTDMTKSDREQLNDVRTDLAVLHNEVSNVKSEILKVSTKIDNFAFVPTGRYEEDRKADEARYVSQKDYNNLVWLVRALIAAIIAQFFVLLNAGPTGM